MSDFLLEIGLEEVPARMLPSAQAELLKRVTDLLTREHLLAPQDGEQAHSYSTPRRLAVLVTGVQTQQPDITEETTGPAVKIAFKDGAATPAAEAFAKKSGLTVADLKTISTPKGDYLAASVTKKGRSAAEVLTTELPKEIAGLYWAKNMRWIPGSNEKFVRPVLWLACLLDDAIVPIEFGGRTAARATYGHRVLSSGEPFEIQSPTSYLAQLEGEYVLADVELRRHKIRKALDRITREAATRTVPGLRWREDEPLVDVVTHLTEWPDVLLGSFEPEYLALPEEVLVTVMRDHQKYFAVESADGKLAPHFLTVTNIALNADNTPIIKQGNERVLRARFNDARFFWEFDQRTPLTDRVKLLENVTFQKDLGSYAAKSERVKKIASELAKVAAMPGASINLAAIEDAAVLAKTDLTTELVKEFTELQGVIGGLYAKSQGVSSIAANIIYDQYLPSGMDDDLPRSLEGAIFGIADRADTIVGMFSVGMEPTGSKDPFALRRAANGIVKILAETTVSLNVENVITMSVGVVENNIATVNDKTADKMRAFFNERIEFYLRDVRGFTYDVVAAVLAQPNRAYGFNGVRDAIVRAEAVSSARGSEDFLAVSAAFRRIKNLLDQAVGKGEVIPKMVDLKLLSDPAEMDLEATGAAVSEDVESLRARFEYAEALRRIAMIRPVVDGFFNKVMVMAPDPAVRANRLALIARTMRDFSRIADFSEIVTVG